MALTPLNLLDFDVTFFFDTDPTAATSFVANDVDAILAGFAITDARLSQASQNINFGGLGGPLNASIPAVYDYRLEVADSGGTVLASSEIVVAVDAVDVQVSQTESADPVMAGSGAGNLVYTVTVDNPGPLAATNVVIDEVLTLPPGVTLDSALASTGAVAGSPPNLTWTIPALAATSSETLTLTLTVGAGAAPGADAVASAASLGMLTELDAVAANNSAAETTTVTGTPAPAAPIPAADTWALAVLAVVLAAAAAAILRGRRRKPAGP